MSWWGWGNVWMDGLLKYYFAFGTVACLYGFYRAVILACDFLVCGPMSCFAFFIRRRLLLITG